MHSVNIYRELFSTAGLATVGCRTCILAGLCRGTAQMAAMQTPHTAPGHAGFATLIRNRYLDGLGNHLANSAGHRLGDALRHAHGASNRFRLTHDLVRRYIASLGYGFWHTNCISNLFRAGFRNHLADAISTRAGDRLVLAYWNLTRSGHRLVRALAYLARARLGFAYGNGVCVRDLFRNGLANGNRDFLGHDFRDPNLAANCHRRLALATSRAALVVTCAAIVDARLVAT